MGDANNDANNDITALKDKIARLEADVDSQWCVVTGGTWETAYARAGPCEQTNELVASAFRQVKYELYCASVDILGFSLTVLPNRNCIARPSFFLQDASKQFEFVYNHLEHCYTDLIWSEFAQEYMNLFRYWMLERQSIAGFLCAVYMDMLNKYGRAPRRQRHDVTE